MPTKPIAAFIGEKGSGKSITQRKTGMLLFGKNFNVTPLSDPKDFDAAVTNSAFVAFDNADSQSTWLCDKLAISATGGSIKKRELYTTNRLIELPIQCFIGITSRTPHFKRDDVAERLLILNVDTINKKISEKKLLDELSNNRNKIMSEVVYHIQEIIRSLKDNRDEDFSSTFRMADFADFAMKVARSFGIENEVNTIFEKLSCEQSEFILEDNPVVELLLEWAQNNFTEEVTNSELCNKLGQLAEQKGIEFPYKNNVRSFAQHMRSIRPSLSEYCDITEREGGGHKKFYKFVSKEENNDV